MRLKSRLDTKSVTLVWIQIAIVTLLAVLMEVLDKGVADADWTLTFCSYCLTLNIVWTAWAWRSLGGSLFSPYLLFIASVSVFNAGQVFLGVFGLDHAGLLDQRFSTDVLARTALLVLFALSSLNLGGFGAAVLGSRRRLGGEARIPDAALRQVAWLLFVIAIVPSIIEARRAIELVASGGYMALYQNEAQAGIGAWSSVLFGFLVPAAFLLLAGSVRRLATRVVACCIIAAFALTHVFLGFRGSAILVVATSVWLWHVVIAPISKKLLLSSAAATFLILPVIGILRVLPAGERSSFAAWQTAYQAIDKPAVMIVREMGGSMAATAYTISLVPDLREYEHGSTYGYALTTLMPNFFWKVHPGVLNSPSKWLVETVSPETAQVGGGFGFSLIAEGYLNFGFLGTAVPMILLGWGVGRMSQRSEIGTSPLILCLIALVMIPCLSYARAEAGNALRAVVWYAGLPYLLVKYWPKRRRRAVSQYNESRQQEILAR